MAQINMILAVLLLSAALHTAHGYSCSADTCVAPACHCAGTTPPGGLTADQMPQMILFTHDDATDEFSNAAMSSTIAGLKNPNGCPVPVTFFTMKAQTTCKDVKAMYDAGHEIASHTVNHLEMGPAFPKVESEIMGAIDFLTKECNLTRDDVVGFRSPYLINNPPIRKVLSENGFLYDSTINEHWPMPTSPNGGSRLFPYTMDNGIPQDCAWTSNLCTPAEKYPGLWEVPVWVLQNPGAEYPAGSYTMDYEGDVAGLLKANFDLAYNGNRAPVPIYIHTPWMQEKKYQTAVNSFLAEALKKPDVYMVTMRQLVEYMKNPVPKEKFGEWLGCVAGGKPAALGGAPAVAAAPVPAAEAPAVVAATPAAAPAIAAAAIIPAANTTGTVSCQDISCNEGAVDNANVIVPPNTVQPATASTKTQPAAAATVASSGVKAEGLVSLLLIAATALFA